MSAREKQRGKRRPPWRWRRIIDECLGKALSNSFRQQILWILNERIASPSELAEELGATLNKVCHHVKVLKDARCIELAHTETIGNRVKHFYKANSRAFLDGADWPRVPESLKAGLRATLLRNVLDDAIDAIVEGTYDMCEGSHMSWTPGIVDEQAREELTRVLEKALLDSIAIEDGAKARLESSGEPGISYTVSLMGYPSIGGRRPVGPPSEVNELVTATTESNAAAVEKGEGGRKAAKASVKRRASKAGNKEKRKKTR
jgi:DNA-binding transcriptional ArsR family regulator